MESEFSEMLAELSKRLFLALSARLYTWPCQLSTKIWIDHSWVFPLLFYSSYDKNKSNLAVSLVRSVYAYSSLKNASTAFVLKLMLEGGKISARKMAFGCIE
jgi:hypothetical protein